MNLCVCYDCEIKKSTLKFLSILYLWPFEKHHVWTELNYLLLGASLAVGLVVVYPVLCVGLWTKEEDQT